MSSDSASWSAQGSQSQPSENDAAWEKVATLWDAATNTGDPQARKDTWRDYHQAVAKANKR